MQSEIYQNLNYKEIFFAAQNFQSLFFYLITNISNIFFLMYTYLHIERKSFSNKRVYIFPKNRCFP